MTDTGFVTVTTHGNKTLSTLQNTLLDYLNFLNNHIKTIKQVFAHFDRQSSIDISHFLCICSSDVMPIVDSTYPEDFNGFLDKSASEFKL